MGTTAWVGVRLMGKIFDNFDFTLNYMYKRVDPGGVFHFDTFFAESPLDADGKRTVGLDARPQSPGWGGGVPTEGRFAGQYVSSWAVCP